MSETTEMNKHTSPPKITINAALPVLVNHPGWEEWKKKNDPPTTMTSLWTRKALKELGIPWEGGVFKNIPPEYGPGVTSWVIGEDVFKGKPDYYKDYPLPAANPDSPMIPDMNGTETNIGTEQTPFPPTITPEVMYGRLVKETINIYEELKMSLIEMGKDLVMYREGLDDVRIASMLQAPEDLVRVVRETAFGHLTPAPDPYMHMVSRRVDELDARMIRMEEMLLDLKSALASAKKAS